MISTANYIAPEKDSNELMIVVTILAVLLFLFIFAVNIAIFVGYRLRGAKGAVAASLGSVIPSVVCILLIALFFHNFRHYEIVENIFWGLRPAVVALIAAPVFSVARSAKITRTTVWIPILSALLIVAFGVSPIYIILAAGVGGFVYGKIKGRV